MERLAEMTVTRKLDKGQTPSQTGEALDILAETVGGSRQSLNQTLHAFERRGWVKLGRGEIDVLDVQALRRHSSM